MSSSPLTSYQLPYSPSERRLLLLLPVGVALCIVAATYAPAVIAIICALAFAAWFLERPYQLLLVMVFLIPFNFVFTIGSVPVAVELLKLLLWIPFLITRKSRGEFKTSRYTKWFAVLAVLIVLSLVRTHDFPYTLKECVRFASNIGLVFLAVNLVDTPEKIQQIFRVLTISTFLVACYGFYQWMIQDYGALFWLVNPRMNTSLAHYREDFWLWRNRITSVLTSELELGHYFNMCLPIGVLLWITEGRRRIGSKWLWMTLAMLLGLLLTFTFGAWAGLTATCGFFVFLFGGKRRWQFLIVSALIFAILAGLVAFGPLRPVFEEKATGNGIGSFGWDVATRIYGWKIAVNTWREHPLIGTGIGNFEYLSADYDFVLGSKSLGTSPHETYLYLLSSLGLVGAITVLVIMLSAIRSNIRLARANSRMSWTGLAIAFALMANIMGWFGDDSGFLGPHASYLLWLLVGISEVVVQQGSVPQLERSI